MRAGCGKRLGIAFAVVVVGTACARLFPKRAPQAEPAPLPVRQAEEEVVVAAWAEPRSLPPAGGQAQILVRAQKRGGAPFAGVEVRIQASTGSLYSQGRILVTDKGGRTRDRLTTTKASTITVNAGGTLYRFRVLVGEPASGDRPGR